MGDLGDLTRLSRVELEPVLARAVAVGDEADADAIWAELGNRVWQGHNPYAGPRPTRGPQGR